MNENPDSTPKNDSAPEQPVMNNTSETTELPTATPAPDNTPVPAPESSNSSPVALPAPRKMSKGLLTGLIVGGAVVLAAIAGWAVFAYVYNSPNNAVTDSFMKFGSASDAQVNGTMTVDASGANVDIDFAFAGNQAGLASADVTAKIDAMGTKANIKAHVVSTKDKAYVKVDDLKDLVGTLYGGGDIAATPFGSIIGKIDGKWIVITQDDIEKLSQEDSTEQKCIQNELVKVQTDASLRKEVEATYKKNAFIVAKSDGSESVNGVMSNRYIVSVDDAKIKAFMSDFKNTKIAKAMDGCTKGQFMKDIDESMKESSSSAKTKEDTTVRVWVNPWTHDMTKFAIDTKASAESGAATLVAYPKLNTKSTITEPKAEVTIPELQTEIQKIQDEFTSMYAPSTTYDFDTETDYDFGTTVPRLER